MAYSLREINAAVRSDPKGFAEECDAAFAKKVEAAAQKIANHRKESHIILLSGPSGSGKTTTALKIEEQLEKMGIQTHTISMDNYFNTIDPETAPRNREGAIDYESPFCLDIELLNRHFSMLDRGETIHVPKYEFARQMRSDILSQPLKLGPDELAIFEGIHALNPVITDSLPSENLMKLYVSVSSRISDEDGDVLMSKRDLRFVRRLVRDYYHRASSVERTYDLWGSVQRGEDKYIFPYSHLAAEKIDSLHAYEPCVFRALAVPMLTGVGSGSEWYDEAQMMIERLERFEPLPVDVIPENSLLREFMD